jgi:hypothetical protein
MYPWSPQIREVDYCSDGDGRNSGGDHSSDDGRNNRHHGRHDGPLPPPP